MAGGRSRRHSGDYASVLAGLRRRAVDAAARRHLPHVDLHAGAVFRQPGGERQGHRAQEAHAADQRADEPAVAREGQEQIRRGRARRAAGDAVVAARGEHQAVGLGAVGRRGGEGCRRAHLRSHRRAREPEEDLRRGAGQGRSPEPAAPVAAPADRRPQRGAARPPRRRMPRARRASRISARASTPRSPARCRSCSATARTSSGACASF